MTRQIQKNINAATDISLLQEIATGSEGAYEIIYQKYFDILRRYAAKRTYDPVESQDIAQEVLIRLWLKRENLSHVTNLYQYLIGAVNYMVSNYFRHLGVIRAHQLSVSIHDMDTSLESLIDAKWLEVEIQAELNRLPSRCRTAFRLSRRDNVPIAEIAKQMQISKRTVENYITSALQHLRAKLGSKKHGIETLSLDCDVIFMIPAQYEPDEISCVTFRQAS